MRLETKRLVLRPPKDNDIEDIVENINNLNVTRWLLVVPHPYTKKDAKGFLKRQKNKSIKEKRWLF